MKRRISLLTAVLFTLCCICIGSASAGINDGLAAYYPFNGNASDASGNGNNGVVNGATLTTDRLGQANSAYDFNGTGDNIMVNASSSLDVGAGNGLTLAAWINPYDLSVQRPIAEWVDSNLQVGAHFWISVSLAGGGPGSLYANFIDTTGAHHLFSTAPGILAPNAYQHAAATYDKTTGIASLYLNGQVKATQNLGIFTPQTSSDLYLGARLSGAQDHFKGVMDELRVYNRVLSPAELSLLAETVVTGCANLLAGPIANATVTLRQDQEPKQTTTTNSDGCYKFGAVVPGKLFRIEILGPIVP